MINKDQVLTIVGSTHLDINGIQSHLTNNFSLDISKSIALSDVASDLFISSISDEQEQDIRKYFFSKKLDCCIQNEKTRSKKILLSDMDATIIENETLDDLVKISGVTANIDETSRLAMEGKIDIRATLSLRVNYLKNKPKKLINEVLNGIKFRSGSKTLVSTLNKKKYITTLITGGFEPISTFVGNKLGFKNIISNKFIFKGNLFSGDYIPVTGKKNSKLIYLNKLTSETKISKKKVVAIGDGANDLKMLEKSGLGIGCYAHQIIRDKIKNQIYFNDLSAVLYYLGIGKNDFEN